MNSQRSALITKASCGTEIVDSIGVDIPYPSQHVTKTRPAIATRHFRPVMNIMMEANLTRGLTRSRCNFVKTQRVFSRAESTVSKVKPPTAKVEPMPEAQKAYLTWPDYLAIRHSKRKWQIVRKNELRDKMHKRVTNSISSGCYDPFRFTWFCGRSSLLWHPRCRPNETNHGIIHFLPLSPSVLTTYS
jgi:hypothetical protein